MKYRVQIASIIVFVAVSPFTLASLARVQEGNKLTPLEDQVRHALVMLPYYSVFDNLEYQVEGTKVVLSGQVVRPMLKREAEGVVKRVAGVDIVENTIEVLPLSPYDNQIRRAIYRAVYGNVGFTKYASQPVPPIHIIVKNGDVRLVGVVSSQSDKNIANINARSVSGVFSVENELRVA